MYCGVSYKLLRVAVRGFCVKSVLVLRDSLWKFIEAVNREQHAYPVSREKGNLLNPAERNLLPLTRRSWNLESLKNIIFFLIFPTLFSFIAFPVNFSTSGKTWNIFFSSSLDSQQSSRSLRYCHSSVPAGQKERGLRLDRRRQQWWVQDLLAWTDKF